MRDLAIVLFTAGCCLVMLWRPWYSVLVLAIYSYMSPHRYAWGFAVDLPVYMIVFCVGAVAFLMEKERQRVPNDWRIGVFYLLWFWFAVTTFDSLIPTLAQYKLIEVSKVYLPLFLTLTLVTSRERLLALSATIGASFGLLAVKGGIWALGTGFSHRVYGPDGTMYGSNNEFAVANMAAIPLLVLWMRETKSRILKIGLQCAIPLCMCAAISSWSRGAMVTFPVLVAILLWHGKRKWLIAPLTLAGVIFMTGVLPEEWFGRMNSIETYEEDKSAMGRIRAWTDGFNYALRNPLTGGGFESWLAITEREWHSAYVEILAEHGFVGALLWLLLVFGTLLSLTRLGRLGGMHPELAWVKNYAYMYRASVICYALGSAFLGTTYWDLVYQLVFMSVLLKQFAEAQADTLLGRLRGTQARGAAAAAGPAPGLAPGWAVRTGAAVPPGAG